MVGSFGHAAAFSFYATKNMMTGEGGMIATDDEELFDKANMIKNHGRGKHGGYSHFRIGYNNRMMDLVAALGIVQLKRLDATVQIRRRNASVYSKVLAEVGAARPQKEGRGMESSYHVYAPCLQSSKTRRDDLVQAFRDNGVGARTVYAIPCHKQDAYLNIAQWRWAKFVKYPDYSKVKLPVSEELGNMHFDVPVHPLLTDAELQQVADTMKKLLS
jgi:perosamine synthetase